MKNERKRWLHACVLLVVASACGTKSGPATNDGTGGMLPAAATATALPCEVATIVQQHCVKCHGTTLRMGAPVHLLVAADFQLVLADGMSVGTQVLDRVRNMAKPMPPPPDPQLTDAEVETLRAFISGGSLAAANGCAVQEMMPATMGSGGTGTTTGTGGSTMPVTPIDAGTGAAHDAGVMAVDGGSTAGGNSDPSWSMFGHDLTNTRDNPGEHTLSADNVKMLHKVWEWKGAATTSTPAVAAGVVYLPAWDGKVYALHAEDGSPVWTATLPNLIDSSPALSEDRVFVSDNMGWVHAIDRNNGDVKWSTQVDKHAQAHVWSSPMYIADPGIVVVGVGSGEEAEASPYTFRGSVVALDAATGMQKWQFFTTDDDQKSGPGVSVWGTAAVDTKRKVLYVGTGNNYDMPAGPYEDSMLALDYTTGNLVWAHQFTTNDIFTVLGGTGPDSDIGSSASLFTLDGKDLIGIGVKNGTYYALDRDTGMVQWMTMLTAGSVLGGVISASAYADGMVFSASNRYTDGYTDTVALDARTGKEQWRQSAPMISYGAVAHANGVLYVGTTAGTIFAYDAATGSPLWMTDAPDSIAGGPAVSGGLLFVPWGYQWTLGRGEAGMGGLMVFGL